MKYTYEEGRAALHRGAHQSPIKQISHSSSRRSWRAQTLYQTQNNLPGIIPFISIRTLRCLMFLQLLMPLNGLKKYFLFCNWAPASTGWAEWTSWGERKLKNTADQLSRSFSFNSWNFALTQEIFRHVYFGICDLSGAADLRPSPPSIKNQRCQPGTSQ